MIIKFGVLCIHQYLLEELNAIARPGKVTIIYGPRRIRNAIINNFNSLHTRLDVGDLWENYLVIERLKKQSYKKLFKHNYFWRTYDKQEIDWIEDEDGVLEAYEFKWRMQRVKPPGAWLDAYPGAKFSLINQENYLEFIT